jgi:hypothetical protein
LTASGPIAAQRISAGWNIYGMRWIGWQRLWVDAKSEKRYFAIIEE